MQERGIKSLGNIADDYMKSMNELCGSLEKLTSTLETMTYMAENGLLQPKQTVEYKEESPDIFEKKYGINQEYYEHTLERINPRRFYMMALKNKNEIFSLKKNDGMLLFLSKIYMGGFECKEDLLLEPSCYVEYLIDSITENWRDIIVLRFGLNGKMVLPQESIANVFCTSMGEIRNIESKCVYKLRRQLIKFRRCRINGVVERSKENLLLSITDKESEILRVEPISCKLADIIQKYEIRTIYDLKNMEDINQKFGLTEEVNKLIGNIE